MKKDLLIIILINFFLRMLISQITNIQSASIILVVLSSYEFYLYKKYKNKFIELEQEGVDIDLEIKEYLSEIS